MLNSIMVDVENLVNEGVLDEGIAEPVKELLNEPTSQLLWKTAMVFLIFAVGSVLITIVMKLLRKGLAKSKMDGVLHTFFTNCVKVVLWVVVISTVLNYLGIPITSFITLLGAAGVAVALALQDSLGNFAGGILIIFAKPFSKGDFIENLEISGKVEQIDLLYTTLITYDNKVITIPNGKLSNSTIINYTRQGTRRVECQFVVGFETDLSLAKDVLQAVAQSDERIFKDPAPIIGVSDLKANGVELELKVWATADDYADVAYFVREQVKLAFDVADIGMARPQMDVKLRK